MASGASTAGLPDPHAHHEQQQQQQRQGAEPGAGGASSSSGRGGGDGVHFVFSAECNEYFDWQSVALYYSYRRVYGEEGAAQGITRLLACSREDMLPTYGEGMLDITPTHVHRSFAEYGGPDDLYVAYNKPGAMFSFTSYHETHDGEAASAARAAPTPPGLQREDPEYPMWRPDAPRIEVKRGGARESMVGDEYLVYLDSDMILVKKVDAEALLRNEPPRTTVAGFYGYLKGVDNGMAKDFDLTPGQQALMSKVGGWMIARRADMAQLSPHWLEMTRKVRNCESAHCGSTAESRFAVWSKSGDAYITRELPRPWISEMYGYVFGSAIAGQRHTTNEEIMAYPGYTLAHDPLIIHYGLSVFICVRRKPNVSGWDAPGLLYEAKVGSCAPETRELYKFDKHWVVSELVLSCESSVDAGGAQLPPFAPVPSWEHVVGSTYGGAEADRGLLHVIILMQTLNDAVLEYKQRHCAAKVDPGAASCMDKLNRCRDWAASGQCDDEILRPFMRFSCPLSCEVCNEEEEEETQGSSSGSGQAQGAPTARAASSAASVSDAKTDADAAQYQMQVSGGSSSSAQTDADNSARLEEHIQHREAELDAKEQQKAGERTKKKSIGELVSEAEGHSVLSSPFGQVRTAVGELVSEAIFFVDEIAEEYLPHSPYSTSAPATSRDEHIGHLHELQLACVAGTALMIAMLACAYTAMFSRRPGRGGRPPARRGRRDRTLAHYGRKVDDDPLRTRPKSKV